MKRAAIVGGIVLLLGLGLSNTYDYAGPYYDNAVEQSLADNGWQVYRSVKFRTGSTEFFRRSHLTAVMHGEW